MVCVVAAEGDGAGQAHWDVAEDGHDFVEGHVAAAAEMGEIMYATMQGMVQEPTYKVSIGQNEPDRHILNPK